MSHPPFGSKPAIEVSANALPSVGFSAVVGSARAIVESASVVPESAEVESDAAASGASLLPVSPVVDPEPPSVDTSDGDGSEEELDEDSGCGVVASEGEGEASGDGLSDGEADGDGLGLGSSAKLAPGTPRLNSSTADTENATMRCPVAFIHPAFPQNCPRQVLLIDTKEKVVYLRAVAKILGICSEIQDN